MASTRSSGSRSAPGTTSLLRRFLGDGSELTGLEDVVHEAVGVRRLTSQDVVAVDVGGLAPRPTVGLVDEDDSDAGLRSSDRNRKVA